MSAMVAIDNKPKPSQTLYRASTFMVKPSTPGMADMGCSSGRSEAK